MTYSLIEQDLQHRKAALQPNQSFIVQAPAGSGKTELLIQRYLTLLSIVKSPEEILAITFTRKAANEMRTRVMKALNFAANHPEPISAHEKLTWQLAKNALRKDLEHDWQLLDNPNRLRIQTIDSLCTFLTKQLPLLSHFGAQPDMTESATELYAEAAEIVLNYVNGQDEWAAAIARLLTHLDNNLNKLQQLLISLLEKRDQWLPFIHLEMNDFAIKVKLEEPLQQINQDHLSYLCDIFPSDLLQQLEPFDITSKAEWLIVADSLLTKQFTFRKRSPLKSIIAELEDNEIVRAALEELFFLPDENYSTEQWQILSDLLQVLKLAAAQLRLTFQHHGKIDFIENAQAALIALGDEENPTDLALALDYQINHLLIDEFQDTSYSQYQLLEKLTTGWQTGDGRTLFVVGDPMQSIYRFREAEVGLFLKMRQQGLKNIALTPLTLTQNFRSMDDIIAWNNKHFKLIFPKQSNIAAGAVSFTESAQPQRAAPSTSSTIHIKGFHSDQPNEQAINTIRIIQTELSVNDKQKIAILVRSRGHLKHIIPALKQAQIPFHSVNIDALSERQAIQDVLALTCALLNPADRIAWLSVLRAPWIGLTLNDLHKLSHEKPYALLIDQLRDTALMSTLSEDGQIRLAKTAPLLFAALNQRERQPIRTWIESIWLQLGGPATLKESHELADIKTYFELLEKITQGTSHLNLEFLKEQVEKLFASVQADNARVFLMTIHSSKGLEFDTVILPHLEGKTPPDELALMQWIEQPLSNQEMTLLLAPIHATGDDKNKLYNYIARLKKIKAQHEQDRLFYVAATRAKNNLYLLFNIQTDKNGEYKVSSGCFLQKLWPHIEFDKPEYSICHPEHSTRHPERSEGSSANRMISRFDTIWENPCIFPESPAVFIHQQTAGLTLRDQTAAIIGTVTHRLLELIANQGITYWQSLSLQKTNEFVTRLLRQAGIHHQALPTMREAISKAIKNIIHDPKGQWILANHRDIQCEFAITAIIDGTPKHMVIDRTFIDENNTRWIIDYKTSHDDADIEVYEKQLRTYAEAMKLYDDRDIKLGLYFLMTSTWHEIGIS